MQIPTNTYTYRENTFKYLLIYVQVSCHYFVQVSCQYLVSIASMCRHLR
jgi:hypothetical protein